MDRLLLQAELLNKTMESLFPQWVDPTTLHCVLDVACGPGVWVMEVATTYPHLLVKGLDISQRMIEYASARAQEMAIANVAFDIGDARHPFGYDDASFDLVNCRTLFGFMQRKNWSDLVRECTRILRPGGILVLTEAEPASIVCDDETFLTLNDIITRTFWQKGQSFCSSGNFYGITPMLSAFLREAGYPKETIRETPYVINYSHDTPAHETMVNTSIKALPLMRDFLLSSGQVTASRLDSLIERAFEVASKKTFYALWSLVRVSSVKP